MAGGFLSFHTVPRKLIRMQGNSLYAKLCNHNNRIYPICKCKKYDNLLLQYGGPDGELGASMRYLSQRYTVPYDEVRGILTDIGSEVSKLPRTPYKSV